MKQYLMLLTLILFVVIVPGCKKNKAPETPSIPSGPASGIINIEYTFTSSAEDPDEDSVAIRFDWGDGDTSNWSFFVPSGDSVSLIHSWSDSGSYTVKAQSKDLAEIVSSWSSGHQITLGTLIPNNPPHTPTTPIGDSIGSVNVFYSFISTAADPDGDSIAIRFIWGDGDTSNWSGWQASGDSISMVHYWSDTGTYNIKAQAKDKKDSASNWSAEHSIKISAGISAGWIKIFGGQSSEYCYSVRQTTDGGYILTGNTRSYGAGSDDVYLIKTDANGDTIWTRTFGGSDVDYGYSVHPTTDGGYIIAGYTRSYGAGMYDIYLIKTDANGDSIWTKTFGGSSEDYGYSVQPTTDGGYVITGATYSYGAGSCDVYLIKTDANGDSIWTKTFGGSSEDYAHSLQQTTDGGYIITGSTESYGAGSRDVYLIKTDANGDTIWTKTFGSPDYDRGYSVKQTLDGGYIITGSTHSYGAGAFDVYLIKTDASGNQQWYKTFGGSTDDCCYSVQPTTDGGYILTGYTQSYGAGSEDVYLIKTDANGNQTWYKTFGGTNSEMSFSVQQTTDGGYIITGYTQSYGTGNRDVYLIKTDANGNIMK